MLENISELKELILWAKKQKVKSLKLGTTEFELSDIALIEDLPDIGSEQVKASDLSVPPSSPRLPDGNAQPTDEEELLFWSARQG